MTERVCQTCGTVLVNPQGRRAYCSERCRREKYAGTCVDCGARTNGYAGPGRAHERCVKCANRLICESGQRADMVRARVRADRIVELWEAGTPVKVIAREMGHKTPTGVSSELNRLRNAGRIGYRYKAYEKKQAA